MKKELKSVSRRFFDSKAVYDDLGVPWKRGLIFYGPAGNGKTISIKALMHTLAGRKDPIPTLYVKAAPRTYDISNVFFLARQMSPCLLVLEDIDTIVTAQTRSYFFNEVDGLENNDGIMMVASTNHIDRLDPGLSKRPSRFDRKYLFPSPSKAERVQYVQYWREKLKTKPEVEFPKLLVEPIARITHDFSFAYIQEAFVSSLLDMAHHRNDDDEDEDLVYGSRGGGDDLEKYELWRVINEQVKILRDEMDAEGPTSLDSATSTGESRTTFSPRDLKRDEFPSAIPREINLPFHPYPPQSSNGSTNDDVVAMQYNHPADQPTAVQPFSPRQMYSVFGQGMSWF